MDQMERLGEVRGAAGPHAALTDVRPGVVMIQSLALRHILARYVFAMTSNYGTRRDDVPMAPHESVEHARLDARDVKDIQDSKLARTATGLIAERMSDRIYRAELARVAGRAFVSNALTIATHERRGDGTEARAAEEESCAASQSSSTAQGSHAFRRGRWGD